MSKRTHEDVPVDASAPVESVADRAPVLAPTALPLSIPIAIAVAPPQTLPQQQQQPTSRVKRQKKGNIFLTNEQRQALCIKAATDKFTQTQLCYWAKDEFGLTGPLNQSTVSRILSERDKYIAIEGSNLAQKRKTYVEHPQLEAALSHWLLVSSHNNQRLQGDLIKEKGRAFARILGIESKISFSNGWLTGFKKRHQTILSNIPGEGAATTGISATTAGNGSSGSMNPASVVDAGAVDFGSWNLQHMLQSYNPRDIFNMDETGLFYAMSPEKVLRRGIGKGSTRSVKEKLTLLLAVNADGSERLDPLFIGKTRHAPSELPGTASTKKKQQQHTADGNAAIEFNYNYSYSEKTWMNAILFQKWLNTLNSQMKIENRHILLLIDDAPSHITRGLKLTNVRVLKLPSDPATGTASTTQQPLETGITLAFKRRYRRRQMVHALDRHEAGDTDIYRVDEVQAMKWCRLAWDDIPKSLVVKCWLNSNLFGKPMALDDDAQLDEVESELDMAIKEISYKLPLKRVMTLKEILSPPEEGENLHFVGTTDADFLAVGDEIPAFHTSESSGDGALHPAPAVEVGSQSGHNLVVAPEAAEVTHEDASKESTTGVPASADVSQQITPSIVDTDNRAIGTTTEQQQRQQVHKEDSPVSDDELLSYVQKIIPNLERLGCDEHTIQSMRNVRQALKQKLALAAKAKQSEATTSLI